MKKQNNHQNRATQKKIKAQSRIVLNDAWEKINKDAAGLDIGSREIYACVPSDRTDMPVRQFGTKTPDLKELAQWLCECQVKTVAMEATGVYWIAVFQILERAGFEVLLVNPRQLKNVSGRKTDVLDCQWIQKLHTFGLLNASFRPADPYCVIRTYTRLRDDLIEGRSAQILLMQKALVQMNLQLPQVISDITGMSGMAIIEAILAGVRCPIALAELASRRVKSPKSEIAKALIGDYREEHLFCLMKAYQLYLRYDSDIKDCEQRLSQEMKNLPDKADVNQHTLPPRNPKKKINETVRTQLYTKLGVDLTAIEGIGQETSLTILTEVGPDLSKFKSASHFCSWLGLCPNNKITGGKVFRTKTRKVVNRVSKALRMAASTLKRSQTALGAKYRQLVAKLGPAQGITAMAHKLARLVYSLLTQGHAYVQEGLEQYEKKNKERKLRILKNMAESMGIKILEPQPDTQTVS